MSVAEEQLRAMGASLAERDEALAALKAEKERLASACSAGMWQCGAQEQEILCVFECVFGGGDRYLYVSLGGLSYTHLLPTPPTFPSRAGEARITELEHRASLLQVCAHPASRFYSPFFMARVGSSSCQ